jgi:hypothetical protein
MYLELKRADGQVDPLRRDYMIVDVDTLGGIWEKHSNRPLPPDLEPYREEPSILVTFTDRDTQFLTFERSAMIGATFLAISGSDNDRMELSKRADGGYDLGIREKNAVTLYNLRRI